METTGEVAVRSRNVGLVEALDRVLDKGVVVDGDIYLSVAGIELVYLKLKLLLASVATVEKFSSPRPYSDRSYRESCEDGNSHVEEAASSECAKERVISRNPDTAPDPGTLNARVLGHGEVPPMFNKPDSGKLNIDPKKVEQGLAKLVLTLVEVLRNLMEKQALRRMELGTLSSMEIERLGEAFMRLHERMKDLKNVFGLDDNDLNLALGPLEM